MEWNSVGLPVLLIIVQYFHMVRCQYDCPAPWETFGEKCYNFRLSPVQLDEAEAFCESNGAGLLSVNSRQEHEFIASTLSRVDKQNSDWYTSGRLNSEREARFVWEGDGTQVQGYEFWQPEAKGKPGDRILYNNNGKNWGWIRGYSTRQLPYICEISRAETFRIVEEERSFSYGAPEVDVTLIEKGPKIKVQPQDMIYTEGSVSELVTFPCQATGNPYPTFTWKKYKNGVWTVIVPRRDTGYTITGGSLVISKPDQNRDNGDYQCTASNKFGSVLSNRAQLNFGYLNDFPKSSRDPVEAEEFSGVGLECNPPKHYPAILYTWYKDSIMNFVRTELKPHMFISRDGKLYFSSVTDDDVGDYYCLVMNPQATVMQSAGKMSLPIPLMVKEAAASIREPKIVNGFPQVFPSAPKQGDTVHMECIAWGTTEEKTLEYWWNKVGGEIPATAKLEDHNRVLVINNVQSVHEGEYECTVRRRNGQSDKKSLILAIEAAPFFNIGLKDQHVDVGSDVSLRCVANGKPAVSYAWYVNATELTQAKVDPADQARITVQSNVLTIKKVEAKDNGMYQCGATNRLGTRFSTAQLRVISLAPTFDKFRVQEKVYATVDGNVTIRCNPEAAPRPDKTWKKDGSAISPSTDLNSGAHLMLLPNGNLLITRVRKADEGLYECTAENSMGSASSSGRLIVLEETVITYPPRDTTVAVNRTAFLHCEATYNRRLDLTYTWYQNGRKVIFERIEFFSDQVLVIPDKHFARGSGIYRGGLYIYQAQYFHAGSYECVAETTTDQQKADAKLTVVGPPHPPAGLYGGGATATTIRLTWINARLQHQNLNPVRSYIVEGYSHHSKQWKVLMNNITHKGSVNTETQSSLITGLSPWTVYRFRVRAVNDLGVGEPSSPSQTYTTAQAPPDRNPTNVGGGGGKVGDLTITWDPLPAEYHNGEGVGYRVSWKKKELTDEDWDHKDLNGSEHNRFVVLVGSKNYYSEYEVQVQVYNKQGFCPRTAPSCELRKVTIMSAEDLPAAVPLQVRADNYNATALLVGWDIVPQTREAIKGILRGYRINYWKEEGEEETMAQYKIVPWNTDSGLIIGLDPKTYYFMNVQVYNHAGFGPKSEWFLEETLRLPPQEMPTEVDVHPIDHYSVEVRWRGVSTTIVEEPLQGYMVRTWLEGENLYVAKEYDAAKKTRLIINNLESNQLYNVRVFGYSLGGEGKMSSPIVQFVLGPDCKVMKEYPDKTYIYTCGCSSVHLSAALLSLVLSIQYFLGHVGSSSVL